MVITTIKIKGIEHPITEKDRFLDNGACIDLITVNLQLRPGVYKKTTLSKKMVKHILTFPHIEHQTRNRFWHGKRIYSITAKEAI